DSPPCPPSSTWPSAWPDWRSGAGWIPPGPTAGCWPPATAWPSCTGCSPPATPTSTSCPSTAPTTACIWSARSPGWPSPSGRRRVPPATASPTVAPDPRNLKLEARAAAMERPPAPRRPPLDIAAVSGTGDLPPPGWLGRPHGRAGPAAGGRTGAGLSRGADEEEGDGAGGAVVRGHGGSATERPAIEVPVEQASIDLGARLAVDRQGAIGEIYTALGATVLSY